MKKYGYQLPSYQKYFEMRPLIAFGYYGGKSRFAAIIRDFLDYDTTTYIEPFGGSAAVLLNKTAHNKEIYVDKSLSLCCFWRCMADKAMAVELIERLYDTGYSEDDFNSFVSVVNESEASGKLLDDLSVGETIKLAIACFIVFSVSRDSAGIRYHTDRVKKYEAYLKSVSKLTDVADRFNGVEVINADALDLLNGSRFNNSTAMLYLDPVYLPETGRKSSHNHTLYRYGFDFSQHIKLLERVREMECRIVISGYEDDTRLYDRYLLDGESVGDKFNSWSRYEIETKSAVARVDKVRTEILWSNF